MLTFKLVYESFIILGKMLVCNFYSWSRINGEKFDFYPEDIDPYLCTHLVYRWADLFDTNITLDDYELGKAI